MHYIKNPPCRCEYLHGFRTNRKASAPDRFATALHQTRFLSPFESFNGCRQPWRFLPSGAPWCRCASICGEAQKDKGALISAVLVQSTRMRTVVIWDLAYLQEA